jgi:glycosyltransferase involved in cell wall biosynthesis
LIYFTTQLSQRKIVRQLVGRMKAEVVHQPIPVSPKIPSAIAEVGAPVIIGPLNGGMEYPSSFRGQGTISRFALILGRHAANLLNLVISGKRKARIILVANRRTQSALPWNVQGRVIELPENGVDLSIWRRKTSQGSGTPLHLIYVGRLVDWKAIDIALEAIARLPSDVSVEFEIIGDGPMRQSWEAVTSALGLGPVVRFSGFLPQQECARRMQQADVFVLPSLFECGGSVVLEAMATGLPVIATAWGGPCDYLDESCGILVEPSSREGLVEGFSAAIQALANSAALREQLGGSGYLRAREHFDWSRKIDRILELYSAAAKESGQA